MADNSIVTSKYNVVTFFPRSLFEQFRRIANVYFLVISILMMVGWYTSLFVSPLSPFSTLVPLILVLGVTMIKDGAEDLKRHRSDKRVCARIAVLFCKELRVINNIVPLAPPPLSVCDFVDVCVQRV